MNIHKILVTTDLSPASERGLVEAAALAKRLGAELSLVTAVDVEAHLPPGALAIPAEKARLVETEVRTKIAARLDELRKKHFPTGITARAEVLVGRSPARMVSQHAKEWGADLIVIATHGATGLRHFLLGSVAEKVLRYAHCPVLVVRSDDTREALAAP